MILKRLYISIILCLSGVALSAQSAGFINTAPDARLVATGNTGYASAGTAFATHYNTAGIYFSDAQSRVAVSYINWQPDYQKSTWLNVGGFYQLNRKIGFALGVRHLSGDDIMRTDEQGNSLGNFTPKEYTIDLGMSYGLNEFLSLGANLRYIGSDLAGEKGTAFAVDLHAMYRQNKLTAGLGITNLGSKIDYGYEKHELPARIKAGVAYCFVSTDKHSLSGNGELQYQIMPSEYSGIAGGLGAEYTFKRMLSVRAGYQFGDEEKTGPGYMTLGCGGKWKMLNLDLAYLITDSALKNTMFVSLGWTIK